MSALKTGVAAAAAFILGWAAHEGIARAGDHEEPTAMTHAQDAQAVDSEKERKQREANEKPGGGSVITPLNVRDPSALVMGPAPARSCKELAAAAPRKKKCDCAAERLKKTGRQQPERF